MAQQRKWNSPTDTGTYASWRAMRGRCLNPSNAGFEHYGARGIKICDEWVNDFDQFYADMGDRPAGHTLERKDNTAEYSAANCKWATRAEQVDNRKTTVFVTHDGETRTLSAWAKHLGVPYYMLWNRIQCHGMDPAKALTAERFKPKTWLHGSLRGYTKGCRCEQCKAARSNYYRLRKASSDVSKT